MYEHKAVGPNLKTYFYYTNEVAEAKNSTKEVFVLATGAEGTGTLYNEIAEYLKKMCEPYGTRIILEENGLISCKW